MFKVTIQSGEHNTTQHTSVVAAAEVVTQRIIDCSKNLIADHYTCLAESSVGVRGILWNFSGVLVLS